MARGVEEGSGWKGRIEEHACAVVEGVVVTWGGREEGLVTCKFGGGESERGEGDVQRNGRGNQGKQKEKAGRTAGREIGRESKTGKRGGE